jgi:hypothetical protein
MELYSMLIRQIEHQIVCRIKEGVTDLKLMASQFKMDYSTLNSMIRRMATYGIIRRNENGTFEIVADDLTVASDKEVHYHRRNNHGRQMELENPLPLIEGEELENLKDFVQLQCEANVPRSVLLDRLKRHGYALTRKELLQFIEYYKLAPKRKSRGDSDETEVA